MTEEQSAAIEAAAKAYDAALTTVYSTMQEIDKRDHQLMVTLRQRYSLPQQLGALARCSAQLVEAIAPVLKV